MRRKSSKPNFEDIRIGGIVYASELVLKHKYEQAKDVFMALLEICPNDVEIMTLHANIYSFEGKLLEAENRLNQVLILNPDYPMALYFLRVIHHEKGEYDKAIHMYENALKYFSETQKKDIADVYQNMGCSLWEVNRREEALEA